MNSKKKIIILPSDKVCRIIATVEVPGFCISQGFDSYEDAADWAINYEPYIPSYEEVRGKNNEWSAE